ncbi:aminotransferase class I/II-fold pyridoxal phosphate-dependent enzyme [Clostridium ganghwense]|uniref:Aminotransferase class I/II-fold pyridoxal phosphate-dependent enzyme n=1 Tax=Clostridium ganghwense TaxID=312089 RepID=A0ABT4CTE5_9CLOT|nr:aminotransferase class I/II-fold pyridoxal phosphate-dependent enzyme [Clostridium ganghwense]MCY6372350.1 aminotransferase class I/II-fold pyridoxal phosphate-dependent enzyme [Clostridium ganghwense]
MKINNRLENISEYHFKKIDELKEKLKSNGENITDLGIGDPDLKTNSKIINALIKALEYKEFNKYPPYEGIKELKLKIINYYREVYSVYLKTDEVLILIGSKEGLSNIIPAVCDLGDYVITPNPGYPVYEKCSYLWGSKPYSVPLKDKNNYLLDISNIPDDILKSSKLMIVNYPNNPTGAIANAKFYSELIKFCGKNNIILCNDAAYSEIINGNNKPISLLQYDTKRLNVEFGTLSKTYNMTGFRIGYVVGNREVLKALSKVKSNLDSSQFKPIQYAAIEALSLPRNYIKDIRKIYDERRRVAENILNQKNIKFYKGEGTFYIWCKVPKDYTTNEFCEELLLKYGIVVTPGYAFGNLGHGHFRISLTIDKEKIYSSLNNLKVYN